MFPLRDDNPTFHQSVATFSIIAINVLSWIFLQGAGFGHVFMESLCRYGLIPGELLNTVAPGAQVPLGNGFVYITEARSDWTTLITSMFMHGGWFHLLTNMWFLSLFGDNVEDAMGSVRFAVFYLLCGFSAAGAQMLFDPRSVVPMIGASGAIGGVMGAYAMLFPRAPVHVLVFLGIFIQRIIVPAYLMLGYWFVLQILCGTFSLGGGVAVWAHVGGFLAGIIMVRTFCNPRRLAQSRSRRGRTEKLVRRILN